jgi:hypothetical protein
MAIFALLAYFLPANLAAFRRRKALLWIAAINTLLGWTLIGAPSPTPAPTAVRQINHLNAEMMTVPGSSARHRLIGKIALQIEDGVKWSGHPDPRIAGKADGEAALEAFNQAAKTLPSEEPARKGKKARAAAAEAPDKLKGSVGNVVMLDAAGSFETPEGYQTYRKAFLNGFNSDESGAGR